MTRLRVVCLTLFVVAGFAPVAFANPAPPPRTGPLRSCGSGAGLGLAAIGTVWGLMWAGRRHADRVAGRNDRPRS